MATIQAPAPREPAHRRNSAAANDHHSLLDPTVWQRILTSVRLQHPSLNRVWFDQMAPRQLTNGVIQVTVATPAQLNFCQSQCQQPFTAAAQSVTGRLVAVVFHCDHLPRGGVFNEGDQPLPLNPDYVFENFVTGPCNRLPHAASLAVSENPGKAYNPLFIHGGVGLGKTHLLQAVCQKVLEHNGDARILYLSCDSFINQFITAIESGDMNTFRYRTNEEFRAKYRSADVLLVDDIQFIAGKDSTEEEFFHTFNSLYESNKQIVMCSDRPPKAIVSMEERLRSRFEWGLIADIQPPDLETRVAILRAKADLSQRMVPDDVIQYLASRVQSNIRELEGSLNRLLAFSQLQRMPLTIDTAKAALANIATDARQRRVSIDDVINAVSEYYRLSLDDLRGKQRDKHIVVPRQVAMYLMRQETEASLMEIGQALGGRDHSTVLHGCDKISREVNENTALRKEVLAIRQQISG